ncbi:MAG TPA: hypothetical protein VKQ32_22715, partial [Polyangia bacterium]|nr:hypothetical protein [Polyangia bacterium]
TPPPVWMQRTPRPPSVRSAPPLRVSRLDREVTLARGTLAGLCMTVFAGGIICALALYRFVPRLRPDAGNSPAIVAGEAVAKPMPAPSIEIAPTQAPPAAKVADVEPEPAPPATPPEAVAAAPKPIQLEATRPVHVEAPRPVQAEAPAPEPKATPAPKVAPAPKATPPEPKAPIARVAVPTESARRAPASSRPSPAARPTPTPAKQHGHTHKAGSPGGPDNDNMPPTETWVDPFK